MSRIASGAGGFLAGVARGGSARSAAGAAGTRPRAGGGGGPSRRALSTIGVGELAPGADTSLVSAAIAAAARFNAEPGLSQAEKAQLSRTVQIGQAAARTGGGGAGGAGAASARPTAAGLATAPGSAPTAPTRAGALSALSAAAGSSRRGGFVTGGGGGGAPGGARLVAPQSVAGGGGRIIRPPSSGGGAGGAGPAGAAGPGGAAGGGVSGAGGGQQFSVTARQTPGDAQALQKQQQADQQRQIALASLQRQSRRSRRRESRQFRQLIRTGRSTAERVRGLFGEAREQIAGVGDVAREEIERQRERELGSGIQSLRARGLAGTSLVPNLSRGVAEDESRRLRALAEQQSLLQSGVSERFAGAEERLGGFISRILGGRLEREPAGQQLTQQALFRLI